MISEAKFTIVGEVASAPATKTTNNGKQFVSFYVRADKRKSDGSTYPNYYECLVWGEKLMERVKEECIKGNPILVEGDISSSAYTNRAGERKTSISLFLGNFSTELSKEVQEAPRDDYSAPTQVAPHVDINSDDLPF